MLKSITWQSWATPTFGGQYLIPGSVTSFFSPEQVKGKAVDSVKLCMKFQDENDVRFFYCTMLDVCLPKRLRPGQIFPLVTFGDVTHFHFLLKFCRVCEVCMVWRRKILTHLESFGEKQGQWNSCGDQLPCLWVIEETLQQSEELLSHQTHAVTFQCSWCHLRASHFK